MTRHCKCVFLRIAFQVCIPLTDPLFLLCRHTAWHLSTWHLTKIAATAYPDIMLLKPLLSNTKAHRWCQINERSKIVLYIHIYVYSIYIYIYVSSVYINTTSVYFSHALQKVGLIIATNSYLQFPLGAPTLCSLAKPTGTESPPVSPEATSAKPDAPQARILHERETIIGLTPVSSCGFIDFSTPRNRTADSEK